MDEFDILPREEKVKIGGQEYTLREITEAASIEERRHMAKGVTFDENGKPTSLPDSLPENEAFTLSRCLFDAAGAPVGMETIKGWPRRTVRALYDKCQALNGTKAAEPKN